MVIATLFFAGRDWIWLSIALVALGLVTLLWNYFHAPVNRGTRIACFALKFAGLAALALCLLEPLWSRPQARPGANYFAIIADNSQGMQIKDAGQTKSRGENLAAWLSADQTPWQADLGAFFRVRRYLFDSRLRPTAQFGDLKFDGVSSALMTSLEQLQQRYQGEPLAGILLFTDGNATDWAGQSFPLNLPPVYPIVIGNNEPVPDLAISKVSISQTAFEDSPVNIGAEIAATHFQNRTITARLVDLQKTATNSTLPLAIQEQRLTIPSDAQVVPIQFSFRPDRSGISFYELQLSVDQTGSLSSLPAEATHFNNTRIVHVDRGQGPYRLLYISGRPNWEYKFLSRALAEDPEIQMAALVRIAKREPKFQFKGRQGESSNPLFRGFDRKDEETERYDQPVLIRLNIRDPSELIGGFPNTAEELFAYHAVILDDIEAEFFKHEQLSLIERFVSERGGGFLMLGGQESFGDGGYARTPVSDLLPVYVERLGQPRPLSNLRLHLTREGWIQPWTRLRDTEPAEKDRLKSMPAFQVINRVRDLKPGAQIIATAIDNSNEEYPALAIHRFGRGRSAAWLVGDTWRWGLRDESLHRDMDKAWRQLVRWLIADVPQRVELAVRPAGKELPGGVQIQVRARDKEFRPLDNASVKIAIKAVAAGTNASATMPETEVVAEPSLSEPGLFEALFLPRHTAGYQATATVVDGEGSELGTAAGAWTSNPAAEEFKILQPNTALLEQLADATGGEVIKLESLEGLVKTLPRRNAPITETATTPVWHSSWIFLFALACFVAEWGLRRTRGLA